jgi:hypothetical protein
MSRNIPEIFSAIVKYRQIYFSFFLRKNSFLMDRLSVKKGIVRRTVQTSASRREILSRSEMIVSGFSGLHVDRCESRDSVSWSKFSQKWQRAIFLRLSKYAGMITDECFIPSVGPEGTGITSYWINMAVTRSRFNGDSIHHMILSSKA